MEVASEASEVREATAFRPVKPPSLARSTPPSPRGAPRPDDRRPKTEDRRPPPPSHLHDPPIVPSVVVRCSVRTEADRILTISNFNPPLRCIALSPFGIRYSAQYQLHRRRLSPLDATRLERASGLSGNPPDFSLFPSPFLVPLPSCPPEQRTTTTTTGSSRPSDFSTRL